MGRPFETYQEMLEEFWTIKVTNESEVQLLRNLTDRLIKTESIWAPIAVLGGDRRAVLSLCDKGVLEKQGKQIRFSHQTVQEFAIARLFGETGVSLSEFVQEHQSAIFSRRTVAAVLRHLRETDRNKYHLETNAIADGQPRLHVMFQLIDFMCRQPNPTLQEIKRVKGLLKNAEMRLRILIGITNRKNWFAALKEDSLPEIMSQPNIEQWPLISVLSNAWAFDWDGTFTLVHDYWAQDARFDNLTLRVMEYCDRWNDQVLELVQVVALRVKTTLGNNYHYEKLVGVISSASPENGARLAARIISTDVPNVESPNRWNSPLEQSKGWYDLEAIATAAPIAYLKEIAPWLQAIVETHHSGNSGSVLAYYAGSCLALDDNDYPRPSPILTSIRACIDLVSKSDPREFIQLFRDYWNSENAVLHRLYMDGLMNVVAECPNEVLEYLVGDNRRFSVGKFRDTKDSQSAKLIGLLVPYLSDEKRERLIQRIKSWTKYQQGVDLSEDQLNWDRESRLHLLLAIPSEYVSEPLAKFIEDEKAQLPEWNREILRSHSGLVKTIPPMTHDQMVSAKDDELIHAFSTKKNTNDREWKRVEGGFEEQGGGEASADELSKVAKSNHKRAGEILRMLVDQGVTSNVDRALEGFENCPDRDFVFALLNDIGPHCEESESFRYSASKVLLHLCDENGLPEEMVLLLEHWLSLPWDHTRSVVINGEDHEWKPEVSLLWCNIGVMILDTDRSYFTLVALTQSLLAGDEPQGDRWINDLSTHLDRDVSLKTWRMFCDRLRYVRATNCSPSIGKALIAKLFNKFPNLAYEPLGCRLLAHLVRFVQSEFLVGIFRRLRASTNPLEQQAVGELLTLSALLDGSSEWALPLLETELVGAKKESDSGFLVGCAHAVSNLWHDLDKPSECARLMIALFSIGDANAINATRQLFWNEVGLPISQETADLIVALAKQIDVVGSGLAEDVLRQMTDILPNLRLEILDFCSRLIEVRFNELRRREFNAYEVGAYLVEIAMTLQRFPESRNRALDLFEQLLRAGLDDADKALKDFDGTEESTPQISRIPLRRRRQQRRRNKDG